MGAVDLILASASPRRKELLERIGYSLSVVPADIDETPQAGEQPEKLVVRLAEEKAEAVFSKIQNGWVLAADTIVIRDGVALGKPESSTAAESMISSLAGRSHQVTTAFAIRGHMSVVSSVTTDVRLRELSTDEVADYVKTGEWLGKAGGYAVQGIAASFVAAVSGSITNVIGLPLSEVVGAFRELGGPMPALTSGKPS